MHCFGRQIVVSLVNNRPSAQNFTYASKLQQWTKATNVRLKLLRTKTLLGHLMAVARQDPTVTRRVRMLLCSLTNIVLYSLLLTVTKKTRQIIEFGLSQHILILGLRVSVIYKEQYTCIVQSQVQTIINHIKEE